MNWMKHSYKIHKHDQYWILRYVIEYIICYVFINEKIYQKIVLDSVKRTYEFYYYILHNKLNNDKESSYIYIHIYGFLPLSFLFVFNIIMSQYRNIVDYSVKIF